MALSSRFLAKQAAVILPDYDEVNELSNYRAASMVRIAVSRLDEVKTEGAHDLADDLAGRDFPSRINSDYTDIVIQAVNSIIAEVRSNCKVHLL